MSYHLVDGFVEDAMGGNIVLFHQEGRFDIGIGDLAGARRVGDDGGRIQSYVDRDKGLIVIMVVYPNLTGIETYTFDVTQQKLAGLAIYDTMQYIRCDVVTLCIGQAASMGSLLLAAGAKGKRYCLPNARVMTHQPSGGYQGQASDIEIHAREILNVKRRLNNIYVQHTGRTMDEIDAKLERDTFMSAEEAKAFGIVDDVVVHRPTTLADTPG